MKIYLASPFFNDFQREVVRALENVLGEIVGPDGQVFSPSRDGVKLVMGESTWEDRKGVFEANCYNIDDSDVVVAVLDGYDTGTMWEVGRATRLNIPVITISKEIPLGGIYSDRIDENELMYYIKHRLHDISRIDKSSIVIITPTPSDEVDESGKSVDPIYDLVEEIELREGDNRSVFWFSYDDRIKTASANNFHAEVFSAFMDDNEKGVDIESILRAIDPGAIAISIDDRNPGCSHSLGYIFADPVYRNRVVTFSSQDYGVNVMLQHSISGHYTDTECLISRLVEIADTRSSGTIEVDESFFRSTEEFE